MYLQEAVADPGFPRGGFPQRWLLFGQFFPQNCMKLKEFGPSGARPWRPSLISANEQALVGLETGSYRAADDYAIMPARASRFVVFQRPVGLQAAGFTLLAGVWCEW